MRSSTLKVTLIPWGSQNKTKPPECPTGGFSNQQDKSNTPRELIVLGLLIEHRDFWRQTIKGLWQRTKFLTLCMCWAAANPHTFQLKIENLSIKTNIKDAQMNKFNPSSVVQISNSAVCLSPTTSRPIREADSKSKRASCLRSILLGKGLSVLLLRWVIEKLWLNY